MSGLKGLNVGAQGTYPRALFVCSGGMLRSATAAHLFASERKWNTRCAGTLHQAIQPLHRNTCEWAEYIFCMESHHAEHVQVFAPSEAHKIRTLNIPDYFDYRNPELERLLRQAVDASLLGL